MQQDTMRAAVDFDDSARISILVVDDDEFSRDLLVRRLQRAGYRVISTNDGRQVPQILNAHRFSLVLLDVVMPLIGGPEVLDAVRSQYGLAELPVIMVSSKAEGEEIADCFRRGANDYVTKPFETQALLARIDAHIARQRAEAALRESMDRLESEVEARTVELVGANQELVQSRDLLTGALQAIGDGFVLWDDSDRLVLCNERYREFYGRNAGFVEQGVKFEDLLRRQAEGGVLRAAIGRSEEWLQARLAKHRNPGVPFEEEFADGCWMQVSETRTASGYTVGLCTDITAIKRREVALKTFAETNRRLAAAVNATESAILITDPTRLGNPTVFANPAFTAMTGWPVEEALGRDQRMLAGDDTDKSQLERLERCMSNGIPAMAELKLYARDGRSFWAEINASPIRNNGGEIVNWVIIQTDITNRRETLEQLNQSQKMEMIGQLTGGLAHDFNNLLTVVLGNLEFVLSRDDTPIDGATREHMTAALEASRRGAELTRRMLAFSRRQTLAPKLTNLQKLIDDFRDLLNRSLGGGIELDCVRGDSIWPVLVDRSQMESAILNLAINARDAMDNTGVVTLSTANRSLQDTFDATGQPIPHGDYVCVAVSDRGSGMTPDVIGKAIQPFFTTKESGKGTGLGLSMVYGFASQSRGFLRIESEPGNGTTVEICLPRATSCPAAEMVTFSVPAEGGSETVLLVDDEPQVRTIAAIQLQRLGYRVLQAEDGPEALELLAAAPQVDLVVTDVGLPGGMNGVEFSAAVRKQRPDIPVLYVSGYSDVVSSEAAARQPDTHFLAKPYDNAALAKAVRRALTGG